MNKPKALEASPKHSPTPWKPTSCGTGIVDANGEIVAEETMAYESPGIDPTLVQLIVRAVNSHEANKAKLEVAAKLADAVIELDAAIEGGHKVPRLEGKVCALAHAFQEMKNGN